MVIKHSFFLVAITFSLLLKAETNLNVNKSESRAIERTRSNSVPSAPYEGIPSGLPELILTGYMTRLMPQYCIFFVPGQGGVCQVFWDRAVNNITRPGGSTKLAYCENMETELNANPADGCQETLQECIQYAKEMRPQLQSNINNYCSH